MISLGNLEVEIRLRFRANKFHSAQPDSPFHRYTPGADEFYIVFVYTADDNEGNLVFFVLHANQQRLAKNARPLAQYVCTYINTYLLQYTS